MSHVTPFGLLGGDLSGSLPNPSVNLSDNAIIKTQVFAPRPKAGSSSSSSSSGSSLELTDGTHDLTGVSKITVSGATVGGTSAAATLTISSGGGGGSGGTAAYVMRGATFTAGSTAISTPVNDAIVVIPEGCTITKVVVLTEGGTGSCQVDIKKSNYSSFPTTSSICASTLPTISSGTKYEDSTLTGWTTALSTDDILTFHLVSSSTFTMVSVSLYLSVPVTVGLDIWSPDTAPTSSNAMDDEFNGTTLDPKWSLFNINGSNPLTYSFADDAITLTIPPDGGVPTRTWQGISQPLPSSGSWAFVIKVRSVSITNTYNFVGFIIANAAGAGCSWGDIWHSSYGEPSFFDGYEADYTAHASTDGPHAGASALVPFGNSGANPIQTHYLRMRYDGTYYYLDASLDGLNFANVLSSSASSVGVTSPTLIVLGGESISSVSGCSMTVDYFRRVL